MREVSHFAKMTSPTFCNIMRQVNASELEPDMVVAEDLKAPSGEMIVPKGTKLIERTINVIRNRSITSVPIEGEEEDILSKIPKEALEEARNKLISRYLMPKEPSEALTDIIENCLVRKLKAEWAGKLPSKKSSPPKEEKKESEATPEPTSPAPVS